MPKNTKIDYKPLFEKYERGEITPTQIAKEYGVNRSSFIQCYNRYKNSLDKNISNTAEHLDKGLTAFKNAVDNIKEAEAEAESLEGYQKTKALREIEANKTALNNTLELLEKNHGVLAQAAISIVGKGLKKANELLDNVETAQEYSQIMSGFKSSVDTIGLFPKSPLVAIQNNINANADKQEKKPFEVKVNFLEPKKKKNQDEIIEGETIDD